MNFEKNFALFSLPNGNIYAEIAIWPEHVVQQIDPNEYDALPSLHYPIKKRERRNFRVDVMVQRRIKTLNETTSARSLLPIFFTVDEHWFPGKQNPFKEFAHGDCSLSHQDSNRQRRTIHNMLHLIYQWIVLLRKQEQTLFMWEQILF